MKTHSYFLIFTLGLISCSPTPKVDEVDTEVSKSTDNQTQLVDSVIKITPIQHATMVLDWGETIIYVDPLGGAKAFEGQPEPDIILITDIHSDHLDTATLKAVVVKHTRIITPKSVAQKLSDNFPEAVEVLINGEKTTVDGISIKAIPMYNLRKDALKYHPKGRGNGYVLEKSGKRVYISGDTEGIPEMRNLKDIDIAFVCMNLPYTMSAEDAAEAVLAFEPAKVYPYHYRGKEGLSRVDKFKQIVHAGNPNIEVVQLDWYPDM